MSTPAITIANWKGEPTQVVASKGGVLAALSPFDNLIRGGVEPWPPPEIVQKLFKSDHGKDFSGEARQVLERELGHYCDLQSLHSEDALTWSVFGTLAYSPPEVRKAFAQSLLGKLGLSSGPVARASIWLWRRLPHPETGGLGGPEVDFGIQTEAAVILGEAKWRSGVARAQGKARNKNQIELRQMFCQKLAQRVFPGARFVVLAINHRGGLLRD
jgi:hypothetical protein